MTKHTIMNKWTSHYSNDTIHTGQPLHTIGTAYWSTEQTGQLFLYTVSFFV